MSANFSTSVTSGELLLPTVIGSQTMQDEEWVEQLQSDHRLGRTAAEEEAAAHLLSECLLSECETESGRGGEGELSHSTLELSNGEGDIGARGNNSLESAVNFEQIFTTIDDDIGSDKVCTISTDI